MHNEVANEYFVIVGLGSTGQSIARYLQASGKSFIGFDTRTSETIKNEFVQLFPGVTVHLGEMDPAFLLNAKEIYLSPGVSRKHPIVYAAIQKDRSVVGDIELFLREVKKPVVGVTGSNGKSTVVTLIGLAAEAAGVQVAVGGNIGIPALDLLSVDAELYVLELSSFQLESTFTANLQVGCILNVSPDHLDRYEDMAEYTHTKQGIYSLAKECVYNFDDKASWPENPNDRKCICFSISESSQCVIESASNCVFDSESGWLKSNNVSLIHKDAIKIKGIHNIANALALFAIAGSANINLSACCRVLENFHGLPHRCAFVRELDGVTYINDSKATNVGAAESALRGLAGEFGKVILIAGGDSKGAELAEFGKLIDSHVCKLIVIGKDAAKIAQHVRHCEITFALSLQAAVTVARSKATSGDLVLLAPACASLDMFANYEERGKVFADCVNCLVPAS